MQVSVRDNNVDQALRVLKKKLQKEGVFREMKLKQNFEKPSENPLLLAAGFLIPRDEVCRSARVQTKQLLLSGAR
jgi:ribosomal protein S21